MDSAWGVCVTGDMGVSHWDGRAAIVLDLEHLAPPVALNPTIRVVAHDPSHRMVVVHDQITLDNGLTAARNQH